MEIELDEMEHGKLVSYNSVGQDKQSTIKVLKAKKQFLELLDYINTLPSNKDYYLLKANALMHLKRWEDVSSCCDLGIQLQEDCEFYNMKGRAQGKLGNMEEKANLTRKAIQIDSSVPAYYRNLGAALYKLKKYEQAIIQHKKAISKEPNNSINYHNVGAAFFRIQNYAEAKQYFGKAVEINHKQALSHSWLGDCYEKLGDLKSAIQCYTRAYEISGKEMYKKERDRMQKELNPKKGFFSRLFS